MNQPTHAWLAVEAYRKIDALSRKPPGQSKKLDGLARLLDANLRDVVIAAWLPDSLIKDTAYGHVFKNSIYEGDQVPRFTLSKDKLISLLPSGAQTPKAAFECVPPDWWNQAYRVTPAGGHLPARVNALCQTVRDMFKMGDDEVVALTGIKPKGAMPIAKNLLFSPRDIAMTLWMVSHYIADAHVPFHCDHRGLAAAKKQTHCDIEDTWGKQVPSVFDCNTILKMPAADILAAPLPDGSEFAKVKFGATLSAFRDGDPWLESVYICRASFAASFALVPPDAAKVDDQKTKVSLKQILDDTKVCGEARFWDISRAIMADAANAIARFWKGAWCDFVKAVEEPD
jgi:hypothetical protein